MLLLFVNVMKSLKSGAAGGRKSLGCATLEWSVSSPPPPYNFAVIPTVASRHPLWENRIGGEGGLSSIDRGMLLAAGKETIGTTGLDAEPDMVLEMPEDSYRTRSARGRAVRSLFVGLLFKSCGRWPHRRGDLRRSR